MNPETIYPILLIVLFIYIQQHFDRFPRSATIVIYILFAAYYTHIRPLYGILAAIGFILYDNARSKYKENFEETGYIIPRTIYQTWSSKTLPPKMAACVARLKQANPDFEYRLFDDADCRQFIKDNYDADVLDAYDTLTPGAFKADLWRYCILYDKGGVYVDIKFQCESGFSFKDILSKGENFYVREYNHKGTGLYPHILYTGVIASKPKNPVFHKCIRQIVENCKKRYYGPEHTAPTGPYLFASMSEPQAIKEAEYAYYEENGVGFIRHIDKKTVILSHYPEYRAEQKAENRSPYWKEAWINREIYHTPNI
jgi:mannosyltransferase OCH1-like enzyme